MERPFIARGRARIVAGIAAISLLSACSAAETKAGGAEARTSVTTQDLADTRDDLLDLPENSTLPRPSEATLGQASRLVIEACAYPDLSMQNMTNRLEVLADKKAEFTELVAGTSAAELDFTGLTAEQCPDIYGRPAG